MSSGRKLPAWMSSSVSRKGEDRKLVNENIDVPNLKYPGKILYCFQKDECNFICQEINKQSITQDYVFGFDIEWKVSYQKGDYRMTAVLQLCIDQQKCYVFHLAVMNGFPTELKTLLESDSIWKTGVGIKGDVDRLFVDFNIQVKNVIDLTTLANKKLGNNENWSLNGLLINQLNLQLSKEKSVRCSDWENYPLTATQQNYAALDGYAGLLIYEKLMKV